MESRGLLVLHRHACQLLDQAIDFSAIRQLLRDTEVISHTTCVLTYQPSPWAERLDLLDCPATHQVQVLKFVCQKSANPCDQRLDFGPCGL